MKIKISPLPVIILIVILIATIISYKSYQIKTQEEINNLTKNIQQYEEIFDILNKSYICYEDFCSNRSNYPYIHRNIPNIPSGFYKEIFYKTNSGLQSADISENKTYSMFPTIPNNAVIIFDPIGERNLRTLNVGDIIIYKFDKPDEYNFTSYVHRIIDISQDYTTFQTKGDNNILPDQPINSSQIEGKVIAIIY